ncbi:hypothetical protein K493DRAFT_411713 [Basidiobolus meristosporus CBS 931.73]|uniref:Nucleoporin Pom152 n=1 Tax=Basidiobolus meristosporus CBS 931.73 TaxID=1314790 RepID=A0A1Y1XB97_9FUNG|nr:hypothetical protein K493DRAFT_411713 [Basidiobolus meristosporus CBS 931.73]|eukprot:ORX83003.1 hypothetical protein K493DRAFT_411713 [Basidiobolus meristosporus CBS 931.73]
MQAAQPPVQEGPRPVIPLNILEGPQQRFYTFCAFGALQAFKAYELYHEIDEIHSGIWGFKWFLVDTLFLLGVWSLRIPWLHRPLWKYVMYILLLNGVNFWLFAPAQFADSTNSLLSKINPHHLQQEMPYYYEENVEVLSGKKGINKLAEGTDSSHILGKHTVRILPHSTAKINPDDQCFCLPRTQSGEDTNDINIPVILNGTYPESIEYSRTDFETKKKTIHKLDIPSSYFGHQDRDVIKERRFNILAKIPGSYKLERVVDQNGADFRLYKKKAVIVSCPEAYFGGNDAPGSGSEQSYCVGDHLQDLSFVVRGHPPLKLHYTRRINGSIVKIPIEDIRPDREADLIQDIPSAAEEVIEIPFNVTLDTPGEVLYKIAKVADSCNNVHDYEPKAYSLGAKGKRHFVVHSRPNAKFECSMNNPMKIQASEKPGSGAKIPLRLSGTGPWEVKYGYQTWEEYESNDVPQFTESNTKKLSVQNPRTDLSVSEPGVYTLLSVSDNYCSGEVILPDSCSVVKPAPPTLQIDSSPIDSSCVGELGTALTLTLTGEPPFTVYYKQVMEGSKKAVFSSVHVNKYRHSMTLLPNMTGKYTYDFWKVDDKNHMGTPIDIKISQVVHPQPKAKFQMERREIKDCVGGSTNLDVVLSGTSPWTLVYDVIYKNSRQSFTVKDIHEPHVVLSPPKFGLSGKYSYSLVKITDANGCVSELDTPDIDVTVEKTGPQASFACDSRSLTFLEGEKVSLPVKLTGSSPWTVSYRAVGEESKEAHQVVIKDPNGGITVNRPGTYELLSVSDGYCSGLISESSKHCSASWISRPSVKISDSKCALDERHVYIAQSVCEGYDAGVDVSLTGQAPWVLKYKREWTPANGGPTQKEYKELTTGSPSSKIIFRTSPAGLYRYTLESVGDDVYTKPVQVDHSFGKTVVEQLVQPKPVVEVVEPKSPLFKCVGEKFTDNQDSILLRLNGQAPFSLVFEIARDNVLMETVHMNNITENQFRFTPNLHFREVGKYTISVVHVIDATGCINQDVVGAKVHIEVAGAAGISPLISQRPYCVGDVLSFAMQGSAPWTISYQFGEEAKTEILDRSKFERVADQPGVFSVTKVCHQRQGNCCSQPQDLTYQIHALPSVRLSGGNEIEEKILEGDQTEILVEFLDR